MTAHSTHDPHAHAHGAGCGHSSLKHGDHADYLHDGHLHHAHEDHVDEHEIAASSANPANCSGGHRCDEHEASHRHGVNCGHEAVPHAGHVDYAAGEHLHNHHGDHCDDHGRVELK